MVRTRHLCWMLTVTGASLMAACGGEDAGTGPAAGTDPGQTGPDDGTAVAPPTSTVKAIPAWNKVIGSWASTDTKTGEYGGSGYEQPRMAYIERNGRKLLFVVSVSSSDVGTSANWQCKGSVFEFTPKGPVEVVSNVQLTNHANYTALVPTEDPNDDPALMEEKLMMLERPCARPAIVANDKHIVFVYSSDWLMADETRIYAKLLDENLKDVSDLFEVAHSMEEDNDVGASVAMLNPKDPDGLTVWGHDNSGGDSIMSYGFHIEADNTLTHTYTTNVFPNMPANIGRPWIAAQPGSDTAVVCSALGNKRPPELGDYCAAQNLGTGDAYSQTAIFMSNTGQQIAYNQISVAPIESGRFAALGLKSNMAGKGGDTKGSNQAFLKVFEFDATGKQFTIVSETAEPLKLKHPTHAAICTGSFGIKGETTIAVMGASPTGVGQPTMDMFKFAPGSGIAPVDKARWITNSVGDSGALSNLYGPNPNNQGRDFLTCLGSVPNPGYKQTDGLWSDVDTMFVQTIAGPGKNSLKNSLYLALVPGKADVVTACDGECGADVPTPGSDPIGPAPAPQRGNAQAGACSMGAPDSSSGGMAGAVLVLGLALAARRRREEG